MIFIDRNSVHSPDIYSHPSVHKLKSRLEEYFSNDEAWRSQRKYPGQLNSEIGKEMLGTAKHLFQSKCAYCETIVGNAGDLERFRPRHSARDNKGSISAMHYWWLDFDWENHYYSCPYCNMFKRNMFPIEGIRGKIGSSVSSLRSQEEALLIDPCFDAPQDHLRFSSDGQVVGLTKKGLVTIEVMRLDRPELVSRRSEQYQRDLPLEDELMTLVLEGKDRIHPNSMLADFLKELFQPIPSLEFAGFRRQILFERLCTLLKTYPKKSNWKALIKSVFNGLETQHLERLFDQVLPNSFNPLVETFHRNTDWNDYVKNLKEQLDKFPAIKSISLSNFMCFEEFHLNFSKPSGGSSNDEISRWQVILGENAVGKTSLLKGILIGLAGEDYINSLAPNLDLGAFLRLGAIEGKIEIEYWEPEVSKSIVRFSKDHQEFSHKSPKVRVAAYNALRFPELHDLHSETLSLEHNQVLRAKNLFDHTSPTIDAIRWLCQVSEQRFNRAIAILRDILNLREEDDGIIRDTENQKVHVQKHGNQFEINKLSEGNRSIFNLVVDIMASFEKEDISFEEIRGLVLVDEIGTHLHPRWKMQVIDQIRRNFKNLDFIVTTHEPLCLVGAKEGEVAVLMQSTQKGIFALNELPNHSAMRVDQILMSPFFGLSSTISTEQQDKFDAYYDLLAKHDRNETEEINLSTLQGEIEPIKYLGDSLREELALFVIDEMLANAKVAGIESANISKIKEDVRKRVTEIWQRLDNSSIR